MATPNEPVNQWYTPGRVIGSQLPVQGIGKSFIANETTLPTLHPVLRGVNAIDGQGRSGASGRPILSPTPTVFCRNPNKLTRFPVD